MGGAKPANINSYKRKRQMNIGIVLFSVVFIYLAVTLIIYATRKKITAYEVREGSISDDRFYVGIALRDEKTIPAQSSGYINYFQSEYSKLGAGMKAYAVTAQPLPPQGGKGKAKEGISEEKQQQLSATIQNFNENYSPGNFSSVYTFKKEVSDFLLEAFELTKTARTDDILEGSGMDAAVFGAPFDGIIAQYTDGYEDAAFDCLEESDFDEGRYKATAIKDNDPIKKGEPAYKLITKDDWEIIVKLDEKTAEKLIKAKYADTRINKDKEIVRAGISLYEKDGRIYGRLKYRDSMIRYAGMRFIGVEIILEDIKGLKIPVSSLTRQDFYVIPKEYIKKEEGSAKKGVDLQKEDGRHEFAQVKIYKTTEDGRAFIGRKGIPPGSKIAGPDPGEMYEVKETEPLTGVFTLNKGYAEFKAVDILCESGDYCIAVPGSAYGIRNYDYIAQDAPAVSEGEVVFPARLGAGI